MNFQPLHLKLHRDFEKTDFKQQILLLRQGSIVC